METFHTICSCSTPEHTLHWHYFPETDELMLSVNLNKFTFWRRLVAGIKYIFGYTCPYGHFDEVLVNREQREALILFFVKLAVEQKKTRG